MKLPRWTHSLKWRIVASYSLILIGGGVSTSIIGIRVTGGALLKQAGQHVEDGLAAVHAVYVARLNEIRLCAELLADSEAVQRAAATGRWELAQDHLTAVRRLRGLDFLSIADPAATVVLRTSGPGMTGDVVSELAPLVTALSGQAAASTELVPLTILRAEDPALADRVRGSFAAGAAASASQTTSAPAGASTDRGMVLLAAAPIRDNSNQVVAGLYAGQVLNESQVSPQAGSAHWLVDQMRQMLFPGLQWDGRTAGAATIFQSGIRISTNLLTRDGLRAIGTAATQTVSDTVLGAGQSFTGRSFILSDWYVTAYEPITNLDGQRIGMLGVGLLQRPYTAVRDQVTLAFAAIALLCFVLIVVVTYLLTRSLMRPLEEMVAVSRAIAEGDLSHRVRTKDQSELGLLSASFNAMLDRIDEMTVQRYSLLEQQTQQWTEVLEQKVRERTEQLAKTQAALDRQQRLASLGQLAAGVAHEINNPLGGILTFASLALEQLPEDSPVRSDVAEIVRQADRCRRIVKELLEFSRQRETCASPRNINDVILRTLTLLEKQSKFQNIQIVRKLDPDIPPAVVDESQMQQVFMNIFLNAADAMNDRGTLTIETGQDQSRQEIYVRISDTGCGIPRSIREAIFDPFFTTKDPGKGTGLGLAVVVRIVQAHGGRIEVDSEVGQGATFTVILPLAPAGGAPAPMC